MGTLITIVSLILFIVLYIFTSNTLSEYDTKEKIKIYFIVLVINLTITMLILTISSIGIHFNFPKMKGEVIKILLPIFIPINGIIYMPNLAKIINSVKSKEMSKEEAQRKLVKSIIVIAIIYIIEIIYLRNVQSGILEMEKQYIDL